MTHLRLLALFGPMLSACNGGTAGSTPADSGSHDVSVADIAAVADVVAEMDIAFVPDGSTPSPDARGDAPTAPTDLGPASMGLPWRREPPNVQGTAIGGTGPNDVWVVSGAGEIWNSKGDGTWTMRTAEFGWRLTGVWGSGPNDVYVSVRANFVFHWNGTGWQKQTDGIAIGLTYETIWGSGPTDIYMADPSIYHSKGDGTWRGLNIPLGAGPFVSIWGSGPNDVWALGPGGVARWNGQVWKNEKPGFNLGVNTVWGSGPNDVYVLYGDHLMHTEGNGSWIEQPVSIREPTEYMTSIWGSARDDIYIATSQGRILRSRGDGRWSGEVVDALRPRLGVRQIWGTSARNIYLLTDAGVYRARLDTDGGI